MKISQKQIKDQEKIRGVVVEFIIEKTNNEIGKTFSYTSLSEYVTLKKVAQIMPATQRLRLGEVIKNLIEENIFERYKVKNGHYYRLVKQISKDEIRQKFESDLRMEKHLS